MYLDIWHGYISKHIYAAYIQVHEVGSHTCILRRYFAGVFYCGDLIYLRKTCVQSCPVWKHEGLSEVQRSIRDRDRSHLSAAVTWGTRVQRPRSHG